MFGSLISSSVDSTEPLLSPRDGARDGWVESILLLAAVAARGLRLNTVYRRIQSLSTAVNSKTHFGIDTSSIYCTLDRL